MSNTVVLNSIVLQSSVSLTETYMIGSDPTFAAGLPGSVSLGQQWRMDGVTGPLVTKPWHGEVTLTAGAAALDLTALVDSILTSVDMTGLKLNAIIVQARSTNTSPVIIAPGASNGYDGWVGDDGLIVRPGAQQAIGPTIGQAAVDGTHKTIDLSSADADAKVIIIMLFGAT